jgi:type I restriction enzyme M protein
VGKVPDPKSQVEQITIGLIYKFMDDLDAEAEELGGKRKFFSAEFSKYGWAKLMRSGLSGHETLNLYAEAISRMPENPGIPALFREIFKNAYLPYRDPETLKAFLKIIDEFSYEHSEKLGDAFEYLLAVLGSQRDAGQFRTPRHIIDFMVSIADPAKTDVVLDPACGTAGFLISAYKHIIRANTDLDGHVQLTPDERGRLADNFRGYDISPDMVRMSLANMYLHGFTAPKIHEYDTLTSQERWNEYADVILANPPFMSPTGGINPHKLFGVDSNRSEVLFVDYIAEHLTPNGRAAIIVPEGVLFQNQSSYIQLRKMLVEGYLVAVISLPVGVFNPYSGVKTSILILDRSISRKGEHIAFFKVSNDGFELGARRRPIIKDDLPAIRNELTSLFSHFRSTGSMKNASVQTGLIIEKKVIADNDEYNLTEQVYRSDPTNISALWPMVPLRDVCIIESGSREKGGAVDQGIPSIGGEQIDAEGRIRWEKMKYIAVAHFKSMQRGVLRRGDVLIVKDGATTGKTGIYISDEPAAVNEHVFSLRASAQILPNFLYHTIRSSQFQDRLRPYIKGIIGGINREFGELLVPLPPLDVQRKVVDEIDRYELEIEDARSSIEGLKAKIPAALDRIWGLTTDDEAQEKT